MYVGAANQMQDILKYSIVGHPKITGSDEPFYTLHLETRVGRIGLEMSGRILEELREEIKREVKLR